MRAEPRSRLVAGCMSGTSLDGIDAVLVRLDGQGLSMRLGKRLAAASAPFCADLAKELRFVSAGKKLSAGDFARLGRRLGDEHLRVLKKLLGSRRPELVAIHGQTLFHRPPLSLQLLNPAPVACALGCPVVFDLRAADLARGGQGAPITPLADLILYASPEEPRIIPNFLSM